jgi:hypothetical protein
MIHGPAKGDDRMRLAPLACLAAATLLATAPEAAAWRGRRHRVAPPAGVALPGYHCPSGAYWRPSLRVCQDGPYRPGADPVAASRPLTVTRADPVGPPPGTEVAPGGRVVDTDTRVVERRRAVGPDGVTVTYVVRTRVVERYPRPR